MRLGKLKIARIVHHINALPAGSLLLYPYCKTFISITDRDAGVSSGLSAIDCSWNRINSDLNTKKYLARKLPFLLAANPTNYAIPYKLSTLEAIAAALYIIGYKEKSIETLNKIKWGQAFLTLNEAPLKEYSTARNADEIAQIDALYRAAYQ